MKTKRWTENDAGTCDCGYENTHEMNSLSLHVSKCAVSLCFSNTLGKNRSETKHCADVGKICEGDYYSMTSSRSAQKNPSHLVAEPHLEYPKVGEHTKASFVCHPMPALPCLSVFPDSMKVPFFSFPFLLWYVCAGAGHLRNRALMVFKKQRKWRSRLQPSKQRRIYDQLQTWHLLPFPIFKNSLQIRSPDKGEKEGQVTGM